jgi:hypothetical protein
LTINRPSCTHTFIVRILNICRKPRHQQKTNQCHLLVLFIIIGLTRSPTLECFLYSSYSSKDQNSEANRKRRERRPTDWICRFCHGTQRIWTPMPPRSTRKHRRLASKGHLSHHSRLGILCHRKSSGHRFVLLVGGTQFRSTYRASTQKIGYYRNSKEILAQQASSEMVKTFHSLVRN